MISAGYWNVGYGRVGRQAFFNCRHSLAKRYSAGLAQRKSLLRVYRIESIQINWQNRRILLADVLKHPYNIVVFENRLYWSDWDTVSMQSCDKVTDKNRETVVHDRTVYGEWIQFLNIQNAWNNYIFLYLQMSIFTIPPSSQKATTCIDKKCSHLCLLSLKETYVSWRHDHGELFIADNSKRKICAVNLKSKTAVALVSEHIGNVSDLAFGKFDSVILFSVVWWSKFFRLLGEQSLLDGHWAGHDWSAILSH